MIDTERVLAKDSMGVLVFNDLGLLLVSSVLLFRRWSRGFKCVIIQVPGGWW